MTRVIRGYENWRWYSQSVEQLTFRRLTYEADILKSGVVILNILKASRQEEFVCGLMSSMLEWSLMWQPLGPLRRREKSSEGIDFPTWSWIGWVGPVRCDTVAGPKSIIPMVKDWQLLTYTPPLAPKSFQAV